MYKIPLFMYKIFNIQNLLVMIRKNLFIWNGRGGNKNMEKSVIFKTFRTFRNNYVYDRHLNSVIAVSDDEFAELLRVEKGELSPECSPVIRKYQQAGLFQPNVVREIHHPQTEILEHHAEKRLKQLILQVTQQCNLRCEYCAYSGKYEGNRTHAAKRMDFGTAKKAIDFFLEHSSEMKEVAIGFYGGEPLLELGLIRQCVNYINEQVEGKHIRYGLTTNGTLLKGEAVQLLLENDFTIGISLDGSKEEHDVSRKFANGQGSFDVVIRNIQDLTRRYPDYVRDHVSIYTTVNPYMNLECVLEYFSTEEFLHDKAIMFNTMVPRNLKEEIPYRESYYQIRKYEYLKALYSMIGKLDEKYVSKLTTQSVGIAMKLRKQLHMRSELSSATHPGGPCLPGVLRLFVNCDGNFYPCERVGEELDYYRIGSVDEGFRMDHMKRLLNVGKLTEEECIHCWNLRQCMMCSNEIDLRGEKEPTRKNKLAACRSKKAETEFALYEQCVLKEFGYSVDEEVM